ncbi:MAG: hypothetical protein NT131_02935 [Methanomassiliicoccales archaeon]|nr:hypothetical protein [Methanomassiliicoccales archaeon]
MGSHGKDATIMALLIIAMIAVALLALLYLEWLLAAIIIIVVIAFLAAVIILVLGGLIAIPFYFAKRGRDSEPGSYKLEQMEDPEQKKRE